MFGSTFEFIGYHMDHWLVFRVDQSMLEIKSVLPSSADKKGP